MNRREGDSVFDQLHKFLLIIRKASAGSSKSKCRAQNHRISNFLRRPYCFIHGIRNHRRQYRLSQFFTKLFKLFPVFCPFNTFTAGSQKFRLTLFQNAFFFKLHCQIQPGLSPNPRHNGIRAFMADNLRHIFQRQRFHIYFICNCQIRHNGCRVGIAQHNLVALLFQSKTCLCTCIIKFCRLANHNRAGTDDKYFI